MQKNQKGFITQGEIWQQPRLWRETGQSFVSRIKDIRPFMDTVLGQDKLRIIFAGAGSSAFVGNCVVPYLKRITPYCIEAIPTTDIVSNPENYLQPDMPTLLISCARSGGSPESIAAINVAAQLVHNLYQVVITCNPDGVLAKAAAKDAKSLLLLMPEDSNDKGFAMTGSFTSMALASILLFNLDKLSQLNQDIGVLADLGEKLLETKLDTLAQFSPDRAVYLGSSTHSGLAQESALKLLELTSGKIATSSDSFLGFRHGPKSVINDQTLVFCFLSQDPYARQYELDLIEEMAEENGDKKLVTISVNPDPQLKVLSDVHLFVTKEQITLEDDVFWIFPYILFAQVYALIMSKQLGVDPDNPSPDGSVNRVVQGVKIYPYKH